MYDGFLYHENLDPLIQKSLSQFLNFFISLLNLKKKTNSPNALIYFHKYQNHKEPYGVQKT